MECSVGKLNARAVESRKNARAVESKKNARVVESKNARVVESRKNARAFESRNDCPKPAVNETQSENGLESRNQLHSEPLNRNQQIFALQCKSQFTLQNKQQFTLQSKSQFTLQFSLLLLFNNQFPKIERSASCISKHISFGFCFVSSEYRQHQMPFSFFCRPKSPAASSTIILKACPSQEFTDDFPALEHTAKCADDFLLRNLANQCRNVSIATKPTQEPNTKSSKKRKTVSFAETVEVFDTYSAQEYDRKGEYLAQSLTPQIAFKIRKELNEFKREMKVHPDSRKFTHFYQ